MAQKRLWTHLLIVAAIAAMLLATATADAAFPGRNGRIAFVRGVGPTFGPMIFTMKPNGSDVRKLTHDSNGKGTFGPVFSPDGTRIVYAEPSWHGYRGFGLFHMRTDGTFQRRFSIGNNPDYSPYGGHIVSDGRGTHGNDDISKVEPNGAHYISLTLTPSVPDEYPAFSPNSRWIVWSQEGELFKMRSNGNRIRRLTRPALGDYLPDWQPRAR